MEAGGEILGDRYRVVRCLGSGGMGTVYLAEHVYLNRLTAVKVLRSDLYADPNAESRFRREAMLAARINHSCIAQVYDFDCTPNQDFLLAMEYVDGETVAQRLAREGPFPLSLALRVIQAAAEGLDRAHEVGILHRDIKSANIMLGQGGVVKLLDFGIARPIDTSSEYTSAGFAVGTLAYMSPEQLLGDTLTAASDIYALGVVLFEMLAGTVPHSGTTPAELRVQRVMLPPPLVSGFRPEISRALSDVIARALAPEPSARWPSATAFARAAEAAAADLTPEPVPSVATRPAHPLDQWEGHFESLRFAGRNREARLARETWAAVRAGRPMLLWIEGEEGSGKSAMFELARHAATADGHVALVGRAYEADEARPFGPWIPILRAALGLRAAKERSWPAITALTDAQQSTSPDRGLLYDEVSLLIRDAATRGPMFVGLEDLHSADAATVSLLEFVASDISDAPLLLVASVTTDQPGASRSKGAGERLGRLSGVARIRLRPLGYEAVREWLASALGREAPEALVRYVYGHTEGNAFFIEQVVRSLVERGELDQLSDERVRLALETVPPPEAVADVVRRRLAGMSDAEREVLQIAAVVGREFDTDLVLRLTKRGEDDVLDAMDKAVARGVLATVDRSPGDWYRFTHGKLSQVLAQAMNPRRRRRMHAEIAGALSDRSDAAPGSVAWHWYRAGDYSRASRFARAAARFALSVHDYDDALTFGVLAAEVAGTNEEKREAHELRGDALRRLDRHEEAAAAFARARLIEPESDSATMLRCKELREALAAGAIEPKVVVEEAERLGGAASQFDDARAAALLLLAEARLAAGEPELAEQAAQAASAEALRIGKRVDVGDALLVVSAAALSRGAVDDAARAAADAQRVFADAGDGLGVARAGIIRGSAAATAGDRPAARAAVDDARRHADQARVTRLVRQISERMATLE